MCRYRPRPGLVDPRLVFEQVAREPQIVTPTGLAVDARGRVFVIESHTHFRPKDYAGPPADRIRLFEDADGDGRFERVSTFFEGTKQTMSLSVRTRRQSLRRDPKRTLSARGSRRRRQGRRRLRDAASHAHRPAGHPGRLSSQRTLGLGFRFRRQRLFRAG